MITLPGSALWLFLLVYFAYGQISDILSKDISNADIDEIEKAINRTSIQRNEEEKSNRTTQLESVTKNKNSEELDNKPPSVSIHKSSVIKPRNLTVKPLESNFSSYRNSRRQTTYRMVKFSNSTEFPQMSAERRNSYLSIAERRKYYNRTQIQQQKKVNFTEVEVENLEPTNKLETSTTETSNEIYVVKKPIVKDSNKTTSNRKNETHYQRVTASLINNEYQAKPQNTRQSVIQSQYQFGQKLNFKRPLSRIQDAVDERSKKQKEKTHVEPSLEISTNKLNRNYPTPSTKLIKVDKNFWTTTPASDVDVENFVMQPHRNDSINRKLEEYSMRNNNSEPVYFPASDSEILVAKRLNDNNSKVPQLSNDSYIPLALNYENLTVTSPFKKEEDKVPENTTLNIKNFYSQDGIFKLTNSTNEAVKLSVNESLMGLKNLENTTLSKLGVSTLVVTTTETVLKLLNLSIKPELNFISNSSLKTTEKTKSVSGLLTTPLYIRNGKFSNYDTNFSTTTPPTIKSNIKGTVNDIQNTTPFVRVIPKEAVSLSDTAYKTKISHVSETDINIPSLKLAGINSKAKAGSPSSFPVVENWSSTEEYPLTIELNENNKRVLGEMFQSSTTQEPRKTEKKATTSSKVTTTFSTLKPIENSSTVPTTTTKITSSTTEAPQVAPPDNFQDDYKAQGTQYNTKFYIAPNVNRNEIIKVVESDEDVNENELELNSRSAGVAVYVLAAFGLVPLMLVLVFGTKFLVQRKQRQYECESDAKSDISNIESQINQDKKKKGSNDLKKSPSNVTTTTLVTTTRLPRVQHWEHSDKQGSKNWELPRSKLRLKTILGQGNFGQVWKAEAEDLPGHEGGMRLVAVKTVKEGATEKEHAEFIKELEIMQQMGSHPNIVTLLGCCTDQEPYYLIMEYVKYGKLLTFLREHRINENYYNFSNNADALTSRDLTVFAFCVARGMEYLSSRGIIHRDLAARNVLVDHAKLCKIADFGMSRSVRDFEDGQVYEERQHKGALPIRWMAPESLVYSVFTYKSDVWSFGMVMWEIVTLGSTPYPNMGAREVMRKVREGYRLERPSHCKPEFYRLISHCWAHDPNKRPDFSELRHELSNLLDNPTKDGSYVDLDRFAIDNNFHVSGKTNDLKLLERNEFKTLKKLRDWDNEDWPEGNKKSRIKKGKNNGKGTVTLTGQGSFTVNSRILEKEFKLN